MIDTHPELIFPEKYDNESRKIVQRPAADLSESFGPLGRDSLRRRRPLWKRIVFASKKVRSIILLNVVTVIYASDIPVLKEVEQIVDPALFSVVRFAVTTIPFLPFMLKESLDSQTRSAGIELGFWVSLGYLTQALGLLTSEAGRASFISAFTIIVVPLIDGIFGAKVPSLTWYGALVSLVGVAMLEYGGSLCVGDILNLLSAVFFGIHILRTEQISRTTKKSKFLALLGYEVFVVALSSAIWFMFQNYFLNGDEISLGSFSWFGLREWVISFPWIPAMYTGIFSTGLCLLAEMDAMCDVSATETAIIYGLQPVWGAAFAWFLLGERRQFISSNSRRLR